MTNSAERLKPIRHVFFWAKSAIKKTQFCKIKNKSWHFIIQGGVNTGLRYGGIYIKSLVPGGVAEQDGHIQTGTFLLLSHSAIINCIHLNEVMPSFYSEYNENVLVHLLVHLWHLCVCVRRQTVGSRWHQTAGIYRSAGSWMFGKNRGGKLTLCSIHLQNSRHKLHVITCDQCLPLGTDWILAKILI